MQQHTVRLDITLQDDKDLVGYLRSTLKRELAAGATRVELLVGTTQGKLRQAAHWAGFLHEGVLRNGRQTESGSQDVHLYAVVAGEDHDGPAGFSYVMNAVLPRTRVIAHVLFRDTSDRILVLQVTYKDDWELPGGVVERHESPRLGAEREVLEEIGLKCTLSQPLAIDWLPPYLGWDDAVEFIFDGGVLLPKEVADIRLNHSEISDAHWLPADEAALHLSPLAARRLKWLDDVRPGSPCYMEDGRAPY